MEVTSIPYTTPRNLGVVTQIGSFTWIVFMLWYGGLHLISYFLYRITAYYCKWNKSEKNTFDHFEDSVKFVSLTFLYVLSGNYVEMFNCPVQNLIIEYIIPFLITLFISGFLCEVSYFRVSLVEMKTWEFKTWLIMSFLTCVFLFLIVVNFIYCDIKDLFFLPVIPCILYFLGGLVLSCISRHPSLKFHPRSYQLAFTLCLFRKENIFYSRLFGALCTGVFVRCVAANRILSLLEPVEEEPILTLSSRSSPSSPRGGEVSIPMETSGDIQSPLLSENEDLILETIEKYNRGEIDTVNLQQLVNECILEEDEEDIIRPSFLNTSRMSDYCDWNEEQRNELVGDNK